MTDTTDTKDTSESTSSTAPTSVASEKGSHSRESTSNYASSSSGASRGRTRTRVISNPLSAANLEKRGYHSFTVLGKDFHVDKRWKFVRELGQGAYGIVVLAQDSISGENVAIKLVTRVFDKKELAKRALREIFLLRHFNHHENITGLIDMDLLSPDFNEIYLFMEPMEADLHQIVRSGQTLTNAHVQYFLYQMLRGCQYIHSANVVHRDLKPGNMLVNADCELKICDFGLSRGFERNTLPGHEEESVTHMTEYVATRWYRAPEIMLSFKRYGPAIDVWSIGCILAELLGGKPIFKGKDYVDQLNLILKTLGTPEERTIQKIGSEKAQAYIRSLPRKLKVSLSTLFPEADPQAIDLLENMLAIDPADRITIRQALAHPYLSSYHEIGDEPECPIITEKWKALEEIESDFEYRKAIWKEVYEFRLSVRSGQSGDAHGMVPFDDGEVDEEVVALEDEDEEKAIDDVAASEPVVTVLVEGTPASSHAATAPESSDRAAQPSSPDEPVACIVSTSLAEIDEAEGTLPMNATLPRTPMDPVPISLPFPTMAQSQESMVPPRPLHNRAASSSSAATLRPRSAIIDPITAYAKRSNSLLFASANSHRKMYTEGAEGQSGGPGSKEEEEWVMPMIRSRAPSSAGSHLIRTLSIGAIPKLSETAVKEGVPVITQADLPPSTLPREFKDELALQ